MYEKPFEDTAEYCDCYYGRMYDLDNKLKREEDKLRDYQIRQMTSWRKWPFGVGLIVVGGIIVYFILSLGGGILGLLSAILIGGYIIYWGCSSLWECFINAANPLAYRIALKCCIQSVPVEIEETYKLMKAIQHGMSVT